MNYPNAPGWKEPTTSREAAEKMRRPALTLRDRIHDLLSRGYALSADEIAAVLDASILSVRPRVAELHKKGLIQRSPDRRGKNASGMSAAVWVVPQAQRRSA